MSLPAVWGRWKVGGHSVLGTAATPALHTQTLPIPGFPHWPGRFCEGYQQGHRFSISILLTSSSNHSPVTDTCGQRSFVQFTLVRLYLGTLASQRHFHPHLLSTPHQEVSP